MLKRFALAVFVCGFFTNAKAGTIDEILEAGCIGLPTALIEPDFMQPYVTVAYAGLVEGILIANDFDFELFVQRFWFFCTVDPEQPLKFILPTVIESVRETMNAPQEPD